MNPVRWHLLYPTKAAAAEAPPPLPPLPLSYFVRHIKPHCWRPFLARYISSSVADVVAATRIIKHHSSFISWRTHTEERWARIHYYYYLPIPWHVPKLSMSPQSTAPYSPLAHLKAQEADSSNNNNNNTIVDHPSRIIIRGWDDRQYLL